MAMNERRLAACCVARKKRRQCISATALLCWGWHGEHPVDTAAMHHQSVEAPAPYGAEGAAAGAGWPPSFACSSKQGGREGTLTTKCRRRSFSWRLASGIFRRRGILHSSWLLSRREGGERKMYVKSWRDGRRGFATMKQQAAGARLCRARRERR